MFSNLTIGMIIMKQQTDADNLYIVVEGIVEVLKEMIIINRNMWPSDMHEWSVLEKKVSNFFHQN
jgi:CRP-like cAMP-binding protein